MVDEQKNTSPEDEYQFPQEEYIASGGSAAPEPPPGNEESPLGKKPPIDKITVVLSNLSAIVRRNKRIAIVLFVFFIVFLILHFGVGRKKPVPLPVSQPVTAPVVQQPVNGALSDSLSTFQQQFSQATENIRDLRSQVEDLKDGMRQLQSNNTKLESVINILSGQVADLSAQLTKLTKVRPTKKVSSIVFHVRAVIPDRAWIMSNQGTVLTVRVGDDVPTYGKITTIDAEQGVINTSSGKKIVYGSNDQ